MGKKIEASGLLSDESGNMFLVFTFPTAGGDNGELIVPRGLAIEPRKIFAQLLNKGAKLHREDGLDEVKSAIDNAPTEPTGLFVTRHGWHGDIYVTRSGVYGPCEETVLYRPLIEDDAAIGVAAGTLEDWREGMREPLAESCYLTFGVSLACGAIIAEPLGVEGGIFGLQGETTTFKSTVARGSQSVCGRAQPKDLASLALTPRAREELCASRSNSLVVADETARLEKGFSKKDVEELIYCIASGRGKIRSAAVAQKGPLANATWHVFVLITSEVSFDPATLKGGAALRYAEIPVPSEKFGGVFDFTGLKGRARRNRALQLVEQHSDCIKRNYGVAGPAFISAVAKDRQKFLECGRSLVEHFIKSVGADGNAQEERLASKFGVAYAGGVIAAELGILPCDGEHILKSVSRLYRKARRLLGGAERQSPSLLKRIENGIRAGHFPILKKGEALETGHKRIWGVRRVVEDNAVVVFKLAELARLTGTSGAARDMLVYWAKQGYLLRSADDKNTRQVEVKGWSDKRQRFVCLKRSALPTLGKAKRRVGK